MTTNNNYTMMSDCNYEDVIFMTPLAYENFCANYSAKNKMRLTISNIQCEKRWQHIAQRGYIFMIQIPRSLIEGVQEVIKQTPTISDGVCGKKTFPKSGLPCKSKREKIKNRNANRVATGQPAPERTPDSKPEPESTFTRCDGCESSCAQVNTRRGDEFFPVLIPVKGKGDYFLDRPFKTRELAVQESIRLAQKCQWNRQNKAKIR